jgi:tetratricopeptide (TPR) repeat protein
LLAGAVGAALCLANAGLSHGQAQKQSDAEKTLIQKAQALEARGRPDIAVQVWQQILLSDPNNQMALQGVARDYRLSGNSTASDAALDKLRKINPSDPNIGKIQGLSSNKTRDVRLGQAGALAKAGNPEAAMKIYREYYGDHPPDGDIALAYYETLYATPNGKQEALTAMRAAAARNPGDQRFIVTLGRMLTYDAKTRGEGIKILRDHSDNSDAQNSLRQALIWDSANPASAAELKEYLKTHPKDTELEDRLKANEGKLAEMNAGIARTPAERAAFAALNAHRLQEAEERFQAMLTEDDKDARAAAGMGFLRMQQGNFGAAISFLVQAEQNGFRDHSVVEGLATSRFWYTMGEAALSFDVNQLDVAAEKYKAALEMRPRSPEALNGLAGIYTKNQQYTEAANLYIQILKIQPNNEDAWRNLFLSYARDNQNQQAMTLMSRFPASVKAKLNTDPDYLRTLASIYQAKGDDASAQKVLAQALALPFPDDGAMLKTGTRLQYAGILMQAKRYDQAAELYKQVLADETSSMPAWMGLVTADHQLQQDREAIGLVEKMPPDVYDAALADPGFLSMLGSIYQQSNQLEIAQGLLERSAKLQTAAGGQPALGLQIQLASIYLQRNDSAQAYALFHQILEAHPDNIDAWRGLIGTMQQTHRDAEALQEIKLIPPAIRTQLETDVQFEQSEASLYAGAGDTVNALAIFNRVEKHYAALHQVPPADVEIQNAYLLYNTFDDRALYPALMRLGARDDMTDIQRETVQGLWANWSVRRSAVAFENGNNARAIDILDAAAQAFPDNLGVRKAVAGGYLKVGRAKEALSIFKEVDFQDATAGDFQGAIAAALAANDKTQAETWLRQALDRYPKDAAILAEAARFEQARGDNGRAADYWRASLAAMPEVTPANRLAHELVNPEPVKPNSRAATPNDLANLLNPDAEPVSKTGGRTKLPPLPSYGQDPYNPGAPVVLAPPQTTPGQTKSGTMPRRAPVYPVPTTTTTPVPSSELMPAPNSIPPYKPNTGQTSSLQPDRTSGQLPTRTPGSKPSASGKSTTASRKRDAGAGNYSGRMHLPPTDDTVSNVQPIQPAVERAEAGPLAPASQPAPLPALPAPRPLPPQPPSPRQPSYPQLVPQGYQQPTTKQKMAQPNIRESQATPSNGLRLSSQPMNPLAAQAQALLAGETDGQLTVGYAANPIHNLSNAAGFSPEYRPQSPNPVSPSPTGYSNAQYTPSAQDAAAGAYSAQKPNQPAPNPVQQPESIPPPTPQTVQQPATPAPKLGGKVRKRRKAVPAANEVPTLVTAPGQVPPAQPQLPVTEAPMQGTQQTTGVGLSDQELQQRNLPPLRGPWARTGHREPEVLSPRDEAEMQLRQIEGGYSGWLGGTGVIGHRTGAAGYDGLNSLDASFEASAPLGTKGRFTIIARPVFLDSGQADGTALVTLTTGIVAEPFGTGDGTTGGADDPSVNPPAQQNAAGIGGEAQLVLGNFAIAGGYTPYGFLVSNWTGRVAWRPGKGPFTFNFNRDSVKDTQLSYAGLRDPYSATSFFPGTVWGGVVANQGNFQFAKGDLNSGFYVGGGGQYLTGYNVLTNKRIDGSMGAYFRVYTMPEYGTLNVGANFFGMHYDKNLQGFTVGMGGYFSPQAYFLANIPITWTGHYLTKWHYNILGSFGVQAFETNSETIFPLNKVNPIGTPALAALTSVGPNYDLRGQVAYAISDHWFVGGFASANNSRNYTTVSAGFSVRYLFRSQPSTVAGPTGLFQTDDAHPIRPLTVP